MTWWAWSLLGFVIWALLCSAICLANYRFWGLVDRDGTWRDQDGWRS